MNLTTVPMTHPMFADSRWHDAKWQHHQVMELFGDLGAGPQARANGQVLFRVEPDAPSLGGGTGRVLVQSSVKPVIDGVQTVRLDVLLDALMPGLEVRLTLRANTVRTINRTDKKGRIRTHRARVPERDLPSWLADRLNGAVELPSVTLVDSEDREQTVADVKWVPGQLRRGKAQLIVTDFHAVGTVIDPDALRALIRDGVGRAKAYGCGLLSAFPV